MIWNENIECMDREQLREIQSSRLVKMAEYVYHNTPFYRKKFHEMGLEPGDIRSIDDIVKLPFTDKLPLRSGRRADESDCAHTRLVGHHRQTRRRALHAEGPGHVGRGHLTRLHRLRSYQR